MCKIVARFQYILMNIPPFSLLVFIIIQNYKAYFALINVLTNREKHIHFPYLHPRKVKVMKCCEFYP